MRILLCTKRDLAGALILNRMLPRLAGHEVSVLLSEKTRPLENAVPELGEMKLVERDLPIDLVFPLADRLGGGAPLATFAGIPNRFGVPVRSIDNINDPAGERLVRDFAPDMIVSARFSLIFKRHIFEIPRLGTYNIHPGALPRYAGLFAPFRCLIEGDARIGCTLHQVDDGIDTGPVVDIGWLGVREDKSLLWHILKTYEPGIDRFFDMLDGILAGRDIVHHHQDHGRRVYASMPDAKAFEIFHAKGFRLFDPKEYMELMAGFVAPGLVPVLDALRDHAGLAADKGGKRCCCEPA